MQAHKHTTVMKSPRSTTTAGLHVVVCHSHYASDQYGRGVCSISLFSHTTAQDEPFSPVIADSQSNIAGISIHSCSLLCAHIQVSNEGLSEEVTLKLEQDLVKLFDEKVQPGVNYE